MGLKVLIVAVWLTLPAAALLLLRGDYERFRSDTEIQLVHAEEIRQHLGRFAGYYEARRLEVPEIEDLRSRQQWQMRFDDVRRQEDQSEKQLGSLTLNRFPDSAEIIASGVALLDEQRLHVQEAARLQDAFVKSDAGLENLAAEAFRLRGWVDYARRFGMWEPYLHYQEALGRVEEQLRQREGRRYELANSVGMSLAQAQGYERELRQLLARLPNQLAVDSTKTYRQDLFERFERFDLRTELERLWSATAWASAEAP